MLRSSFTRTAPIAKDVEFLECNANAPVTAPATVASQLCHFAHSDSTMLAPPLSLINAAFTSFLLSLKTYYSCTSQPIFISSSSLLFLKLVLIVCYFYMLKANE